MPGRLTKRSAPSNWRVRVSRAACPTYGPGLISKRKSGKCTVRLRRINWSNSMASRRYTRPSAVVRR